MDDITASIIVQCQTSGASQAVNKLGFAFAMLTKKAVEFGVQAVGEFRATQDASWKFGKTFANYMGTAEKAVHDFMDTYNLSEQTARSMLTDTAGVLKGFGFTEKEALKVSEQVSRMGVDLASFTGYAGGAKGAVEAITAAMLGETERLKGLNTVIRMDSNEFKNLSSSIMKSKGVSEQQARALATLELVMSKNKDAIGDYMAEGENFTQTNNNMGEAMKQLESNIGQVIYESLGLNDVFGGFVEILNDINAWFKKEGPGVILFLGELRIGLMSSLKSAWAFLEPLGEMVKNAFENLTNFGQWFCDNWGKIWSNAGSILKAAFLDMWEYIQYFWGSDGVLIQFFVTVGKAIGKAIAAGIKGGDVLGAVKKEFNQYWDNTIIEGLAKQGKNTETALAKAGVTKAPELVGGFPDFSKVMGNFENVWKEDAQAREALKGKVASMFDRPTDTGKGESAKPKSATTAAQPAGPDRTMVDMLRAAFRFRETAQSAVMAGTADAARLQSRMFGSGATNPQQQSANSLKTITQQMSGMMSKVDAAVATMTGIKQNTQAFAGVAGIKKIGR